MTPGDIRSAHARIAPHLRKTPVVQTEAGAFGPPRALDIGLTLKLELLQHTGSFKPRGALNSLLSAQSRGQLPAAGVIAASGGNHGAAVAWAAQRLGVAAEIFVPSVASPGKVERIRSFGATAHVGGVNYAQALAASTERARVSGALVVHAYDQPDTISGQGTVALEFGEQAPDIDTVVIACGGGGLVAGVAAWYAGRVKVVAVEPEACPTLYAAQRAGMPVDVEVGGIAVDSLGARRVGELAFAIAVQHIAPVVLVSDAAIRSAQSALWRELRVAAEPGSAVALAALLSGAYEPQPGERIGVLVCGGNVDPASLV